MGMALPITTDATLIVHAIDLEAGVIVLRDATGTLLVVEYQGTLTPILSPDQFTPAAAQHIATLAREEIAQHRDARARESQLAEAIAATN